MMNTILNYCPDIGVHYTLSEKTKKLEAIYQQHINDLEELKKSILQKAFNGELNTTRVS
jgi:hypothetical protein